MTIKKIPAKKTSLIKKQLLAIIRFLKENFVLFGLFVLICIIAYFYFLFAHPQPSPQICKVIKENATHATFNINGVSYDIYTHHPFNIYKINNLTLNKKPVILYSNCKDILNLKADPHLANLSIEGIKNAKTIYLITKKNNSAEGLIPLIEFKSFCANGKYKYLNATCHLETDTNLINLANKSANIFVIVYTTLNNTNLDISKENVIKYSSKDLRKVNIFNYYLIFKLLGLA